MSLYRNLFVWMNCTSLKHFTYEDIVGTWYIIPLTLFLGFSRFIRSKPIPVRTYFMEPSKLSRTAGCLKKKIKDKCIYILYLQVFYLRSYFCWSFQLQHRYFFLFTAPGVEDIFHQITVTWWQFSSNSITLDYLQCQLTHLWDLIPTDDTRCLESKIKKINLGHKHK